jgi:hypothetical protein
VGTGCDCASTATVPGEILGLLLTCASFGRRRLRPRIGAKAHRSGSACAPAA